jgi:hypothetical protein
MPASDPEQQQRAQQRRDTYDGVTLIIAVLACFMAGAAAWFTWEQAEVARDQTRRALRAYVVVDAEIGPDGAGRGQFVWFKAENMGQTPVYDFMLNVNTAVVRAPYEDLPFRESMRAGCARGHGGDWEAFATTFSRTYSYGLGFSVNGRQVRELPDAFEDGRSVYGYGTACYWDVFDQPHAVHFCYVWSGPGQGARRCSTGRRIQDELHR